MNTTRFNAIVMTDDDKEFELIKTILSNQGAKSVSHPLHYKSLLQYVEESDVETPLIIFTDQYTKEISAINLASKVKLLQTTQSKNTLLFVLIDFFQTKDLIQLIQNPNIDGVLSIPDNASIQKILDNLIHKEFNSSRH